MNVLMLTNIYVPLVGGVTNSIRSSKKNLERLGHRVRIVAPSYAQMQDGEVDIIRIPSLHNVLQTSYSLPFTTVGSTRDILDGFSPDIIHAHHPFFLGTTALNLGSILHVPVVYTYHTRLEFYTHYVFKQSQIISDALNATIAQFSEYCDAVIAPTSSMRTILRDMGVKSHVEVIPSGCDITSLYAGDGRRFREAYNIPQDAFLVGFISRLAEEKNVQFLMRSLLAYLDLSPSAYVVIVGEGDQRNAMEDIVLKSPHAAHIRFTGTLEGENLSDAFNALSVFAFASKSETQGMVISESLAAGVPVVALAAPGASDIVRNGSDGFLVTSEREAAMAAALLSVQNLPAARYRAMSEAAKKNGARFDDVRIAQSLDRLYRRVIAAYAIDAASSPTHDIFESFRRKWSLWTAPVKSFQHFSRH